ncbi:hypothetical protein LUU34_01620300 [Aix galericulata]|nr:hypothetical protein LUU34_01620300 [Aix galericulata]
MGDPRAPGPAAGAGTPQRGQDPHQERAARLPARLPRARPEEEPGAAGGPRQREEPAGATGATGFGVGAGAPHPPLPPAPGERGRAPPGPPARRPAPHEA